MTKYREILRLFNLGINQTGIASSCGCARKTVRDVVNRAKACNIIWPLPAETTETQGGDTRGRFYCALCWQKK